MATVEEQLTRALTVWGVGSVVVGAGLALSPRTRRFGGQTAAWGAIDAAIAGVGAANRRKKGPTDPVRLRRVLLANVVLDVGYVAGGVVAMTHPAARRRGWRPDGAATVVQGAFLLGLDSWAAVRVGRGEGRSRA